MCTSLSDLECSPTFTRLQTTAEGGYAQVIMATDERRQSPTLSDVQMGLIAVERLGHSFVSLTSRCDAVGFFLIGDDCQPCPTSGAACPGARL